jgi:hypothetical protein
LGILASLHPILGKPTSTLRTSTLQHLETRVYF